MFSPGFFLSSLVLISLWERDFVVIQVDSCADPEGYRKNNKSIGFLSNTGTDPLKKDKATKPAFNVGPTSHASETPFKWRFIGKPMMVRL